MGINMYLSEVKEQASYANTLAIAYKGYAQELNNSIDFFTNTSLTGKAYQSEKDYFNMVYKPLLRGLNLVCNYLIDAHYYFSTNYTSTVWSSDLEEDQLLHQIELTKQQIQYLDELCTKMPYLEIGFRYNIQVLYSLQVYFEQILSRFGDFNDTSSSLFANVEAMLEQVEKGISVIESNAGWDPIMQKYDLSKIDMSWSLAIETLAKANGASLSIPESELQKEGEELQKELEKRTHTMLDVSGYREWMWLLDPPNVTQDDVIFNERYNAWLDDMVEMYGREAVHGEQEIDPLSKAVYELREGVDYDTGRELSNIEKMYRVSMLCSYGISYGLIIGYASYNPQLNSSKNSGSLTKEQIQNYKNKASNNPDSDTFVLGSTGTYDVVGEANGYTFFQMSDDVWDDLVMTTGENYDEVWRVNSSYIDDQINAGKDIVLSNDPNVKYTLPNGELQFYQREIDYLKELDYDFIKLGNGMWQAVK